MGSRKDCMKKFNANQGYIDIYITKKREQTPETLTKKKLCKINNYLYIYTAHSYVLSTEASTTLNTLVINNTVVTFCLHLYKKQLQQTLISS